MQCHGAVSDGHGLIVVGLAAHEDFGLEGVAAIHTSKGKGSGMENHGGAEAPIQ